MVVVLIFIHLISLVSIIALVLLHRSKGSNMGVSFGGGSSQTMFGSAGPASFISKLISIFAVVFFVTSLALTIAWQADDESIIDRINQLEASEQPVQQDLGPAQQQSDDAFGDEGSLTDLPQ